MQKAITTAQPSTRPTAQVYGRYAALWLLSLLLGFGFFLAGNLAQRLDRLVGYAELVLAVTAPALANIAVEGPVVLIQQTLDASVQGRFIGTMTITAPNGDARWQSAGQKQALTAPVWLNNALKNRLSDVQKPLITEGVLVGSLQLSFATEALANDFWYLLKKSALFAALLASLGVCVGLIPLRRALKNVFSLHQQADATLRAIHEGVISCSTLFKVLSINPAALRLLGYGAADAPRLLGQDVRGLLPQLFLDNEVGSSWMGRAYDVTRKDGTLMRLETGLVEGGGADAGGACKVMVLRDVSQAYALASAQRAELLEHKNALLNMQKIADSVAPSKRSYPTSGAANELDTMTAWVLDLVAEQKSSRLALENQKFAMDQHVMVVTCDASGAITYANTRYCTLSGYDSAQLLGQRPRFFSPTHPAEHFYTHMLATIAQGEVWRGTLQAHNKQGSAYWINATAVPLFNEYLVQSSYMLMGTDITQDQQNRAKLSAQLDLMAVLLEAIPAAIYVKDAQGRYALVNAAFEKLFGLKRSDLIGRSPFDIAPRSFAELAIEKDRQLQASGGIQTYETPYTNPKTGFQSDFLCRKALTTDDQGRATGIVGVIMDVTERNLTQQQLQEATRLAEAANQAKSNFLANMSHEIRTPMNGVMGMTELALELCHDPIQRDYLSLATSSAQALMVVVNDILDISKIEANRIDIEVIEFSLPEVLQHSVKAVETLAKKKGLGLTLELSPDLPDRVQGDPTRLHQVLLNLLDNAVKFTPQGSVAVHVKGVWRDGRFALNVAVQDTGIGIAPAQQSTVFELFNQADAGTSRKYGGSGLGLTISAKLAALMGGRVTLVSALGQGSTFTLELPLTVPQQARSTSATPAPIAPVPPSALPLTSLRVLLVEDNVVNQILCRTILKNIGHTVVVAQHGQEALDLFGQQPWDVILMDMQMPVMDGLDATRAIRALEKAGQHTPIVAMTANAMESDRQLCLDAGMDDYLSKPFKFADLQAILEKEVGRN